MGRTKCPFPKQNCMLGNIEPDNQLLMSWYYNMFFRYLQTLSWKEPQHSLRTVNRSKEKIQGNR